MYELIAKYFPGLTPDQKQKFAELKPAYEVWNSRINVISRRDMDNFYLHHVLHSLSIAKIISFEAGTTVLDVGTGGGFPGIPLAILFPGTEFVLLDSIHKKIKVVSEVSSFLKLTNVRPVMARVEDHKEKYDFIISRAVTAFHNFVKMTSDRVSRGGFNAFGNGIICLKGGDISEEIRGYINKVTVWEIKHFYNESFFDTKKIVYLHL